MASRTPLTFALNSLSETNPVEIAIDQAVIAGWTVRYAISGLFVGFDADAGERFEKFVNEKPYLCPALCIVRGE